MGVTAGASGQHVDLQQAGDGVHAVEDAERQADVDDGGPEGVAVEVHLHLVAEVRAGPEGGHDPQLWGDGVSGPGPTGHVRGLRWRPQPCSWVDSKGWVLLSGDLLHLGRDWCSPRSSGNVPDSACPPHRTGPVITAPP